MSTPNELLIFKQNQYRSDWSCRIETERGRIYEYSVRSDYVLPLQSSPYFTYIRGQSSYTLYGFKFIEFDGKHKKKGFGYYHIDNTITVGNHIVLKNVKLLNANLSTLAFII